MKCDDIIESDWNFDEWHNICLSCNLKNAMSSSLWIWLVANSNLQQMSLHFTESRVSLLKIHNNIFIAVKVTNENSHSAQSGMQCIFFIE